ncbi:hypothetical protein GC170_19665 [bacterium]|nr:hypothetical protein [bacterium]
MNESMTDSQDHVHSDRSIQHVIRSAAVRILYGAMLFLFFFRLFEWVLVSIFYPATIDLALHAVRFDYAIRHEIPANNPWFISSGLIAIVRFVRLLPFEYRTLAVHAIEYFALLVFFVSMLFWSRKVFSTPWPAVIGVTYLISRLFEIPWYQILNRDGFAALFVFSSIFAAGFSESRLAVALAGTLWMLGFQFRPQTLLFLPCMTLARLFHFRSARPDRNDFGRAIVETAFGLATGFVLVNVPLWSLGGFPDYYVDTFGFMRQGGHNGTSSFSLVLRNFVGLALNRNDLPYALLLPSLVLLSSWCRLKQCLWILTIIYALLASLLWVSVNPVIILYHYLPVYVAEAIALGSIAGCSFMIHPEIQFSPRILALVLCFVLAMSFEPVIDVPRTVERSIAKFRSHDYSTIMVYSSAKGTEYLPEMWKTDPSSLREFFDFLGSNVDSDTIPVEFIDPKKLLYRGFLKNPGILGNDTSVTSLRGILYLYGQAFFLNRFAEFENRFVTVPDAFVIWVPQDCDEATYRSRGIDYSDQMHSLFETIRTHYEPVARFGEVEIRRKKPSSEQPGPDNPDQGPKSSSRGAFPGLPRGMP